MFFPKEKHAIFRDLGLFLFMYLGDGQNLADTLRLTYDERYFATHGKQLRFLRNKTKDRNESASEVIFPVTEELQKIMDQYASEPKLGKYIFLSEEQYSTGIPTIQSALKENGSPKAEFVTDDIRSFTEVFIPVHTSIGKPISNTNEVKGKCSDPRNDPRNGPRNGPAPNFLKNLSKTGGLSLQDAACANFAKEKSEA